MKENWTYKKLGEVAKSELGKTLNKTKDTGELTNYLCAINILWDKIDLTTLKQARFDRDEIERYSVKKGDLLICEGGDIGRAAIWDREDSITYQNALHRIRFQDTCYPRFYLLYLYFLKKKGILDLKYGKGVTIKHLVKSSLLSIPIPVPPVEEQERIVEELDLLSGIIEKQKLQLKELDTLAQSIFYDTFGDPITNEKNWEVKRFGELIKLKSGDSLSAKNFVLGKIPVYGGNGISGYHNAFNYDGEFIIIGRVGVYCGNTRLVKGLFWLTDNAFCASFDTMIYDKPFLCYLLNTINLHRFANQAAQPVISNVSLKDLYLPLPPLSLQEEFAEKIEVIEKQKEAIGKSIKETQLLFDYTMDKYFG